MELNELAGFMAIVEAGSFTRAAAQLRLSQPALSRRISLLEAELGALLLLRQHDGARLTTAGEAFLPYARRALTAVQDGTLAVASLTNEAIGQVRLALVGTLASTTLISHLQQFRQQYPQITLTLSTARSAEVSAMVLAGEADLGLRYFAPEDSDLQSTIIGEEPLVVVCAGQTTMVPIDAREPDALRGCPWISFPVGRGASGEPYARVLERQLLRCSLDEAPILIADSLTAQKRLIEADFALGLLPLSSISEELQLGSLRVLDLPALAATVPIVLLTRRSGFLSAAARQLAAALHSSP